MTVANRITTSTVEQLDDRRRPDLDEIDRKLDEIQFRQHTEMAGEYRHRAMDLEYDATWRFREVNDVSTETRREWLEKAATYLRFASEHLTEALAFLPYDRGSEHSEGPTAF